jgi:hypothetical protein
MVSKLTSWMKLVHTTQEQEISCSECLDQVSQYVDLELAASEAAQRMPQLKHHLDQCRVCREEYQVLRDLRSLEDVGELPSDQELFDQLKRHPK